MLQALPFLVYAAREGYGWVTGRSVPSALREQFRRAAGKMPDFDVIDAAGTSGVVNVGEWVLAFRFMRQVAGDSRGRDCAYLAMSYFKAAEAGEFNADALLLEPAFKVPQKTPPETIEYAGGKGISTEWREPARSENGVFDASGSLAGACAAVARMTRGSLRIARNEPDDGRGARYEYRRAPEAELRSSSPAIDRPEPAALANAVATEPCATSGCPWRTAILLAIWAFLLGVLVGRRLWP